MTKFTTYAGRDGNYGSVPIVLFNFDEIPASDFDLIDFWLEDTSYAESNAWDKLIAYLEEHNIAHVVFRGK